MAPHSSTLAWKIPWTEKLGRLQSMGSHRVGHDWRDLAAAAAGHHHGGRERVEGKVIKIGTFVEVSGWDAWCFTFLYGGSDGKASAYNAGDLGLIPGWERLPGEGNGCILAWRIPWTEEPDRLLYTGSQRVRHDWSDWALILFLGIYREPVFLR